MGTITFFSDSEEFLHGVQTGIEFTNDSALEVVGETYVESDNPKYGYMLVTEDRDEEHDWHRFYDGSSFDYAEKV